MVNLTKLHFRSTNMVLEKNFDKCVMVSVKNNSTTLYSYILFN